MTYFNRDGTVVLTGGQKLRIEKKLVKKHYDPGVDHDINPFIKDMLA